MNEPGAEHPVQLGYYGGPHDGRYARLEVLDESHLWMVDVAEFDRGADYTITRYGVHTNDSTLCWVLLTYSPIVKRGKL